MPRADSPGLPCPRWLASLHRRFEALGLPILGPGLEARIQLDLRPTPDPTAADRSQLLHRLEVLEIPGVHHVTAQGEKTLEGWQETWEISWTPRSWEGLFVAGRKGVTLEEAATLHLQEALTRARSVTTQVRLLLKANAAGLLGVLEAAAQRLEEASLDAASLPELVTGAQELWQVGALPRWARTPLRSFARPLVQRLYEAAIRSLPHLPELASVSDPAHGALGALGRLAATAGLPTLRLNAAFEILATGPRGRSRLRGRALSICLSRGLLDAATLDALLRTRLEASDLGEMAAFLEGLLVKGEPDRLVEQDRLWRAVDAWLGDAPPAAFARALLPLRRALAGWPPRAREAIFARVGTQSPAGAAMPTPIPLDPRASEALERALERLDGLEL